MAPAFDVLVPATTSGSGRRRRSAARAEARRVLLVAQRLEFAARAFGLRDQRVERWKGRPRGGRRARGVSVRRRAGRGRLRDREGIGRGGAREERGEGALCAAPLDLGGQAIRVRLEPFALRAQTIEARCIARGLTPRQHGGQILIGIAGAVQFALRTWAAARSA